MVWPASRSGRITRSARRLRAIQTPSTTASTITSSVATSVMVSVTHRVVPQVEAKMPARQTTVGISARTLRRRTPAGRSPGREIPRRLRQERLERVEQPDGDRVLDRLREPPNVSMTQSATVFTRSATRRPDIGLGELRRPAVVAARDRPRPRSPRRLQPPRASRDDCSRRRPGRLAHALAGGGRGAVEHDRHDHDQAPATNAPPTSTVRSAFRTGLPSPGRRRTPRSSPSTAPP